MTLNQISRMFGHYTVDFRRATDGHFTFFTPSNHSTSMGIEITFHVPEACRIDHVMEVKNIIRLYDVSKVDMINAHFMTYTLYIG